MRILMSGATGLIGKEVGKRLIEKGHQITALVRDTDQARKSLPFPARLVQWRGGEEISHETMKDVDAIINLAGESVAGGRWTAERKKKILDSRIQSTRALVTAALAKKDFKVFISGSAVGIYGDRKDEVLDEESPKGEGFLADVTAQWEDELRPLDQTSIRTVAVRTAVVLARHGGAMTKLFPLFEKGVAGNLGNGQQWMSWIHLDDISRLFLFALEDENVRGPLNGSAPEPLRNDRFTLELARALGKSVFLPVPESALKIALGEMSSTILASQRVIPKKAQALGFKFEHGEIVETLQSLAAPLRGGQHEIFSEQWLPLKPDALFPFYCDEKNLESLTPPFLKFRVLNKSTPAMNEGTLINYRLSLHGLPFKWQTRIEDWAPNKRFVDTQLKGPYKKWYHIHDFIPLGGGTLIRDRVTYKLPFGLFGDAFVGWKVSGDVEKIFAYRRDVIDEQFGEKVIKS
jgi:uncharacterized protein (TIGR01777 family)